MFNNKSEKVIQNVTKNFDKMLEGIIKANALLEEEIEFEEDRYAMIQMQINDLELYLEGINQVIIEKENAMKKNLEMFANLQSLLGRSE